MAYMVDAVQKVTPTTGQAVAAIARTLILTPAGTLATLTVNFPTNPVDGQEFWIRSNQILTALTMVAAGKTIDTPTLVTLTATGKAMWRFDQAGNKWWRFI